jgi:hypothetical protein
MNVKKSGEQEKRGGAREARELGEREVRER